MHQSVSSAVEKRRKQRRRRRVWTKIVSIMACLVVFCTTYALILPAITLEQPEQCDLEEHVHSENCYQKVVHEPGMSLACTYESLGVHVHSESCYNEENQLTCGQADYLIHLHNADCWNEDSTLRCQIPEVNAHEHTDSCYRAAEAELAETEESTDPIETEKELSCTEPEVPVHIHSEACFAEEKTEEDSLTCTMEHSHSNMCYGTWELVCTQSEHVHNLICQNDPEADVETEADWMATFDDITLSGKWEDDLLTIARSQLGYRESTRNYEVMEDGCTIKGYTRYGEWYGKPYDDWGAMFVSFCLNYADVKNFPYYGDCSEWIAVLQEQAMYAIPSEYIPSAGDIIFFDRDGDNNPDHAGIVETVVDTEVYTIEGNSNDCVEKNTYALHDGSIVGYGMPKCAQIVETENFEDESVQSEEFVDWEDANALAVLVDSDEQTTQPLEIESQSEAVESTSPYSLRASVWSMVRAGLPLDLKPYIKNVTMYDENGKELENGATVTEGDELRFQIDFVIDGQQLGDMVNGVKTDTLVYQLPETFKIVKSEWGYIPNQAGQRVGEYEIDGETGTITLTFYEEYVNQNINGNQISGYVSFYSTVTKISDADNEDQEYNFNDKATLGVVVKEYEESVGDLAIKKKVASVVGDEIIYEVEVTSEEGTKGPITITDTMSTGLTFKEGLSVKKNGATVAASFNAAADKSSFTMTLPEMKGGDSYIIRYKCNADIDALGADMTVSNTATVNGKDSQDHDLKHETTVNYTFDVLKKTGTRNGDGTITWNITINQAKVDISGWTLKDVMTTADGSTSYSEMVTIQNSSGTAVYTKLPYKFPNGSTDTYTITYTTAHDYGDAIRVQGDEYERIYNKAILVHDGKETSSNAGVIIGSPITKTGTAGEVFQDENGKYILPITWTVTIDTTLGEIPAGESLIDIMRGYPSNDMYMNYDQLMAALKKIDEELVRVSGIKSAGVTAYEYLSGEPIGRQYSYNNLRKDLLYERFDVKLGAAIPKGKVLTFTYGAYGVFDNNVLAGSTYVNRFNISERHEVQGRVDFSAGAVKGNKMAIIYYDPVAHGDKAWFWGADDNGEGVYEYGNPEYYEYERLHENYLAWAIELSTPLEYMGKGNVVLYEDLPEGVTVKRLTLPFFCEIPIADDKMLDLNDIQLGHTYTWECTLYPADQYLIPEEYREGGQTVSVTINVTDAGDLEIIIPGILFETMAQYAVLANQDRAENEKHKEWFCQLHIFTQIDEDFEWTPMEEGSFVYLNRFENKFTLKNESGEVLSVGEQTQTVKKDETKDAVRKKATVDNNNIINYSVVINAYGRDLVENAEILSVHDEMRYTSTEGSPMRVRLVPGSVKLYEVTMRLDGSYIKEKEIEVNYSRGETSLQEGDTTTWVNTLDMTVPDGKALVLEYAYKTTGEIGQEYDVLNTCTISGVGSGGLNGNHKLELEVKNSAAQADTEGIMIFKVDSNSDGIFLEDAKFNIYIWNKEQQRYIQVRNVKTGDDYFVTDPSGKILLDGSTMDDQFAYNTAYYIVEVESPDGYFLSSEKYYFQIVNTNTEKYPSCLPPDFQGQALTSGDIIYRKNVSNKTEISVEKYWKDYNGNDISVTGAQVPGGVTLELWQMLEDDPGSAKLYGTYTLNPEEDGGWRLTIKNLPKKNGAEGANYLYYIKEVAVNGYQLEGTENNEGINSGLIKLVNRETEEYELPETGGTGTTLYTMAGSLLMLCSTAFLLYRYIKRRREAN